MVMLVPFTTALPAQNDYSEYAPGDPETCHESRAEEKERLAADKQHDTTRKQNEEPEQDDFSKVLGMLLNPAVTTEKLQQTGQQTKDDISQSIGTIQATASEPRKATTADSSQSFRNAGTTSAPSTPSGPTSPPLSPVAVASPITSESTPSNATLPPTRIADIEIPGTTAIAAEADEKPRINSSGLILPGKESSVQTPDVSYSILNAADLQTKADLLPKTEISSQQLGIETNFRPAARPYETTKDTDAVTQEIMNTLSRAVAATAPTKNRSGVDGLPSKTSAAGLSDITNLASSGTEPSGGVISLTTPNNGTAELLKEPPELQKVAFLGSRSETDEQFVVQQSGSDGDRSSDHSATRDKDRILGNVGHTSSQESDGARLSSSGTAALAIPDLTTSVTSEIRQPLSSQVARAVIEHLERKTASDSETLTVQLDPADLGEMVIELSKSKEGLAVKVTARESVTMDMLLARGSEIENQLRGEKMDLRSIEFLSPDMMSGGAFQRQTSQDSTSRFDQPAGAQRRNSRNGTATQISSGATTRTGDSQHTLNFRA